MKRKHLIETINSALEAELSSIYEKLGIESGDISPWDSVVWDQLTDEFATLFLRLIDWNTPEE